ncbi:MAG: helix-turn-helix transcriptional regulator [Candidatus Gastranaerophilales bacterium]
MQEYEVMYHKIIATNVKILRKRAKFSQEVLAEKLCCSREFISRVENFKEKISLKMLIHLSVVFETKPEIFFSYLV